MDRIDSAMEGFSFGLRVGAVDDKTCRLLATVETTYNVSEPARVNHQLRLKLGGVLETGSGRRIELTEKPVELDSEAMGGSIRHGNWTITIPPNSTLYWPFRPYQPYGSVQLEPLSKSVGRLTTELVPNGDPAEFVITVD
jgi:hypothetical protein